MSAVRTALVVACLLAIQSVHAQWQRVFEDHFDTNTAGRWTYEGVTNASGNDLFDYDAVNERVAAAWDQSNFIDGGTDPMIILNASFSHPLPRVFTDHDTFRVRATLRIDGGSIPDTTEFYQIANFGLYNMAKMGADRTLADDWSANTNLVRDGSDFVEFNYFINNNSLGFNPNISANIGGTVPNDEVAAYTTGFFMDPWYHLTDMGVNTYLPEDTNLYVEVIYYGSARGEYHRRAWTALYTDSTWTNLLTVNGVPMFYWTQPLPETESFEVTHVAIFNYAALNWGGTNGTGAGSFDDIAVDHGFVDGEIRSAGAPPTMALTWQAVSGTTYAVVSRDTLTDAAPVTQAIVTATGEVTGWTNHSAAGLKFFFIEPLAP